MSKIVDLHELVPGIEDVILQYKGAEYKVPGDLDSETVFEFMTLFDDMIEFQREARDAIDALVGGSVEEQEKHAQEIKEKLHDLTKTIEKKLLVVLQIEQPDLEKLPFGQQALMPVVGVLLEAMGIAKAADPVPPTPTPTPRRKTPKRKTSATRRSTKRVAATPRRRGKKNG